MSELAGHVDLSPPWLTPYAAIAGRVLSDVAKGARVAQALMAAAPQVPAAGALTLAAGPLRFVAGDSAPAGEAYESYIFRRAAVPTRDNLHDLFNGLIWLHAPRTKRRLNELQAAAIARAGVGAARGPLRDALTLFDENGAVLQAPPALWQALIARDWHALFVTQRSLWREARLRLFGHALLEKLCHPRKPLTAHVLLAAGAAPSIANDDAAMAAALCPAHLARKPFVPLPVLGVPGWCLENENFSFYDEVEVFRPPRAQQARLKNGL